MHPYKEQLWQATVRTFEELCYLDVAASEPDPGAALTTALVRFKPQSGGPIAGHVAVSLPEAILREAADNMVGDGSVPLEDVLREIANVVCGHTLTEISGGSIIYEVAPPQLSDQPKAPETVVHFSVRGAHGSIALINDAVPG